jgi:hypothetical protein
MYYTVMLVQHLDTPVALGLAGRPLVLSTRAFLLLQQSEKSAPEYDLATTCSLIASSLGWFSCLSTCV